MPSLICLSPNHHPIKLSLVSHLKTSYYKLIARATADISNAAHSRGGKSNEALTNPIKKYQDLKSSRKAASIQDVTFTRNQRRISHSTFNLYHLQKVSICLYYSHSTPRHQLSRLNLPTAESSALVVILTAHPFWKLLLQNFRL